MVVSEIKLYEILKLRLGEKEAEALVEFVEAKIKESDEENLKVLATKEDMAKIKEDMAKIEGRLETKIVETKADLMKWMFIFWASQLLAIFSFIKFLK